MGLTLPMALGKMRIFDLVDSELSVQRQHKSNARVFKRTRTKIPVALIVGRDRDRIPHIASIVQTSFLGAQVQTKTPLKPGQEVKVVRMTGACGDVPSQVVWVGKRGSSHEGHAGLIYTNPLTARITS
jgi:hypothetical protein